MNVRQLLEFRELRFMIGAEVIGLILLLGSKA
jgi:hypothetical protein